MADNAKLPEQIVDALKDIEEFTGVDVKKVAVKTANVYVAQATALGLTFPLVLGGPPSLSQEQTRRPDENLPAQGHGSAEPMRSLMVATTSTMDVTVVVDSRSGEESIFHVVPRKGPSNPR